MIGRRLAIPVALLAGASAVRAQEPDRDAAAPPAARQDDRARSGSHDGTAPPAAQADGPASPAIDLSVVYTGEVWRNTRGGLRRGERYLDNLDLTLTVDAERALGWRGVTLFAYGLYNNGASFSGDLTGDIQTISNIETGVKAARLYEAWIDKRFAGGRASVRFGLYDLNSEFDTTEAGSLSLLSSHGIGPDFAQSGRNGPSIFPVTSLALRAEYKPTDRWTARAAVLDGVPGDPARPKRTAIKLRARGGALLVGEIAYTDADTKAAVGAWAYTSRFAGLERPADGDGRADNRGAYLLVERHLLRTRGGVADDVKPGLAGFLRLGFAQGRINPIGRYVGGGLVHTGLFRRERDDRLGVTVARAAFGRPYRRAVAAGGTRTDRGETVVELTYRTPLTPWLTIQPDLQYVADPGGDPAVRDALALGLRAEIGF